MADQFPSDIMYKILSRMPVKSLARLRCVSKLWCNYINDPYFETMHAQRSDPMFIMFQQSKHGLLNSRCTVSFLEYKEEEEEEEEEAGFCTREVRKKPTMDIMCKNHTYRHPNNILLGSCNGLLYTSRGSYDCGGDRLNVIHPIRKECYELPPLAGFKYYPLFSTSSSHNQNYDDAFCGRSCGLGFDNSTQTFKMVLCLETDFYKGLCTMVHVLGTTSWRQIPQVPSYPIIGEGVFANGCLYWLVVPHYGSPVLISFDMAKEEFGLVALPMVLVVPSWKSEQLAGLHGQLGYVCDIFEQNKTEVWILKEKGWVRHCEFKKLGVIKVLGFCNEEGDLLMKVRHNKLSKMTVYKLKSESLHEVNFVGWEKGPAIDILSYQSSLFLTRYSIKYHEEKSVSPLSVLLGDLFDIVV